MYIIFQYISGVLVFFPNAYPNIAAIQFIFNDVFYTHLFFFII